MLTTREIKEKYYINSKDFLNQLELYYASDKMTNELAENLQKIAGGLIHGHWFIGYTSSWKEEMVGDAILKMYIALENKNYKIDSGYNPFSYFNQIAWRAFCNRIQKEKKQHEGLQDYKQRVYMDEMSETSGGCVYVKPILESDENDNGFD